MFNVNDTIKFLLNGVENTDSDAIKEKVVEVAKDRRNLNIKFGLDPSAPDIHLGHAVALRKLKQLQDLGHNVTIIIGDFTGMIGDPSGKSKTRNQLSADKVKENAQTYVDQIFKILDKNKTTLLYNSDWYSKMTFPEIIELCSKTTIARLLERDDFSKRYKSNSPIAVHEFFYPLMQAYDSVLCKADIEMGGTDQTFNVMLGRNIQRDYGLSPQIPLFVPLLEGIDGVEKMSKSLGNYIGISEHPNVMFEKVMKIPDSLIVRYFKLTTDIHPDKIKMIEEKLESGVNPRDVKMVLAKEIVSLYHGKEAALSAADYFVNTYQKQKVSSQTPTLSCIVDMLDETGGVNLIALLHSSGKYKSKSDVRRLIDGGAVKINGNKVVGYTWSIDEDFTIQVGKGTLFIADTSLVKKKISSNDSLKEYHEYRSKIASKSQNKFNEEVSNNANDELTLR